MEKLLPCYKLTVTVACLKAIRKLQKFGHLPSTPNLFRSYAAYGQFVGKRSNYFVIKIIFEICSVCKHLVFEIPC